jgi:hypothetical protein
MTSQPAAANPRADSGNARSTEAAISASGRVFTYKDTAIVTPNSSTPCTLLWMDLRAEADRVSVPAVDPKRYYLASRTH